MLRALALIAYTATAMNAATLTWDTPTDPALQAKLEAIDASLREKHGMTTEQAAAGVLDLETGRVAMIHPDRIEYAASVAKIGILLAYFQLHPEASVALDSQTRLELGQMAKASSNEMATRHSRAMGLRNIQEVLNAQGFYDPARGGGIWMGKHYGSDSERIGDPVGDNSHGITVRQVLRFYQLLDQDKLVSPAASRTMKEIFATPSIPHDDIKFVKGLAGRNVTILRKWGSWEEWLHDSALVTGEGRRYAIVGITRHAKGDAYLEELAAAVDDLLSE